MILGAGHALLKTLKGRERILVALALCDYLTASQITRLLYAPASYSFVQKELKTLIAHEYVVALPGRHAAVPTLYTLTGTGERAVAAVGMGEPKRVRPAEERNKAENLFFVKHTAAVSDVIIAALLLSRSHPDIVLTRLYTERSLKRKLYLELTTPHDSSRTICIEPDASMEFTIQGKWSDFFHVEVYRTLPPADWRFKQKVTGYVAYAASGQHEHHFQTPALGIAVLCETAPMVETLRKWTEEALLESKQPDQGERFFFRSGDTASASPAELFLTPFWQQPFSDTKTPLIVRE
jgi:hypothetical protein